MLPRGGLAAFCVLFGFIGQQAFAEPKGGLDGNGLCIGKKNLMSNEEYQRQKRNCVEQHRNHWHFRRTRERKERECIEDLEHARMRMSSNYLYCCDGYVEVQGECKPRCEPECQQGECVAPNQCECAINFSGPACNESCSPGRFGTECELDCGYLLDSNLNSNYAHCSCSSANTAASSKCKAICMCKQPNCNPGWVGSHCDVPCPDGTYGDFCMQNCTCNLENTRECSKKNGQCVCKDQFYGSECEHKFSAVLYNNSTLFTLVLIGIGLLVLLVTILALYIRRRSAKPLRFLMARYSHTAGKENSIYSIGTLPCTNKLRDDKLRDDKPRDDKAFDSNSDKLKTGLDLNDQPSENLYETIDKDK